MEVSRQDSLIELTEEETGWLVDPGKNAPPEVLRGDGDYVYRSFKDKLEHLAKEIYHGNSLTVIVSSEPWSEQVATYNEQGLIIEDTREKSASD